MGGAERVPSALPGSLVHGFTGAALAACGAPWGGIIGPSLRLLVFPSPTIKASALRTNVPRSGGTGALGARPREVTTAAESPLDFRRFAPIFFG